LENDIVPELIQDEVTGENIYTRILEFLNNREEYEKMAAELARVREMLSEKKASQEVASIIEEMVNEER
jgi:lipid-A-disaccharide synthase